jgi:hypothetical protein
MTSQIDSNSPIPFRCFLRFYDRNMYSFVLLLIELKIPQITYRDYLFRVKLISKGIFVQCR